jgi:hypothetical protein
VQVKRLNWHFFLLNISFSSSGVENWLNLLVMVFLYKNVLLLRLKTVFFHSFFPAAMALVLKISLGIDKNYSFNHGYISLAS